ncbi:MAG: twitching motility protein PilH [Rhodanobacteraceae bacterium]|jgi:twitching motility two-component system response regulator PilH|nr:MAG: twitching motility protein PilH [Rhodanobacteraceae bacterium]
MPVFDLFKRLVGTNAPVGERRGDERIRASAGARVLVVDDSATIRAVLGKMLAQDSYEVLVAADGESAVTLAQAQLPDLIFLDIVLPGISGFAVLRALRRDSRTRTTPIIMMSGNQQATEQFYVQRFGADGFVKKPFGRADVFHAIRSLVQAGRMPGRLESAPVDVIPEGMTQEEWNAIPDIGMPDEAHMVPEPVAESAVAEPVAPDVPMPGVTAAPRVDAPVHGWSVPAASGVMRPSIGSGMQGALHSGSTPLVVHVNKPQREPAADATDRDEAVPSHEAKD